MHSYLGRKIRMSMAAVVVLYLLGGMVFGSSVMWFDLRFHDNTPKSMIGKTIDHKFDGSLWTVLFLVCAGVGLPLGMYVLTTLHDCEELENENHRRIT